jgi:dUTP diphosphatase
MTSIRITLAPGARAPTRGSAGSAGYDLYAPTDVLIRPGQVVVIHSGVSIELPDDSWEAQIRSRSSMSKRGLWGATGTVDADYRGVIGATLVNLGNEDAKVLRGERFAQLVFARVEHVAIDVVTELSETERGTGGFGSTGR